MPQLYVIENAFIQTGDSTIAIDPFRTFNEEFKPQVLDLSCHYTCNFENKFEGNGKNTIFNPFIVENKHQPSVSTSTLPLIGGTRCLHSPNGLVSNENSVCLDSIKRQNGGKTSENQIKLSNLNETCQLITTVNESETLKMHQKGGNRKCSANILVSCTLRG